MMNSFNHMLGGRSARSFLLAKSCNKKWTKQGTIFQREENHSDVTLGLQSYSKTICLVGEYAKNNLLQIKQKTCCILQYLLEDSEHVISV